MQRSYHMLDRNESRRVIGFSLALLLNPDILSASLRTVFPWRTPPPTLRERRTTVQAGVRIIARTLWNALQGHCLHAALPGLSP